MMQNWLDFQSFAKASAYLSHWNSDGIMSETITERLDEDPKMSLNTVS